MRGLKHFSYRICRWFIGLIARPSLAGTEPEPTPEAARHFVYVLNSRSLSDLIVVDLVCGARGLPTPLEPIEIGGEIEDKRFFFLNRATGGWFSRNTMQTVSARMSRILRHAADDSPVLLVPVAVFWGRAPQKETGLRALVSEDWAVTSRLKRLVNLFVSRRQIVVSYGKPVALCELARIDPNLVVRRAARLLRVRLRNQRVAILGPDFSHQRTLVNSILASRAVQQALRDAGGDPLALEREARKAALGIASNMSSTTIRVLARILTWFWQNIYRGVEIHGLAELKRIAEGHTLVYVPSHRSHIDYLLLSYLLYHHGLMIPHIAAGDNLNLPLLGPLLRRGGAFFMRRRFRDDPIYTAVFSEYLYQVYRSGHCVEFFPEGGRSRTGRLLPARLGLLKMTLEHHARGIPRPLALVPVYLGYEKLVEASSYLDELRGIEKRRESIADVLRGLKLIGQNFGKVDVNFGEPLVLGDWVREVSRDHTPEELPRLLGEEVLRRINRVASVNPINLVALVTLSTPRFAIDESMLVDQIGSYLALLRADAASHRYAVTDLGASEVVRYVEELGMLTRERHDFGDVLCHDAFNAVLMTWYRNNCVHTLALPSLIACLVYQRRRPLNKLALTTMVETVYPYIAAESSIGVCNADIGRWLEHLVALGLLELHPTGGYASPGLSDANYQRLQFLASIISPTLERLYIVICLLATPSGAIRTRASLESESQKVAHKMSRIYGLNAPEFFDARLFNGFVDKLVANGVVNESADGSLCYGPLVVEVLKAAKAVINPEFRYAILREG